MEQNSRMEITNSLINQGKIQALVFHEALSTIQAELISPPWITVPCAFLSNSTYHSVM